MTDTSLIRHLFVGALLLAAVTATVLRMPSRESARPAAFAAMQQANGVHHPGFSDAFGRGPAVRNLIF